MNDNGCLVVLLVFLLVVALLFLEPLIVMWLWNVTVAVLFGWPTIGYWMAFGLTILCHILFGKAAICNGKN